MRRLSYRVSRRTVRCDFGIFGACRFLHSPPFHLFSAALCSALCSLLCVGRPGCFCLFVCTLRYACQTQVARTFSLWLAGPCRFSHGCIGVRLPMSSPLQQLLSRPGWLDVQFSLHPTAPNSVFFLLARRRLRASYPHSCYRPVPTTSRTSASVGQPPAQAVLPQSRQRSTLTPLVESHEHVVIGTVTATSTSRAKRERHET